MHPELYMMQGNNKLVKENIEMAVYKAWDALDGKFLYPLVDSIPTRVIAVIKATGRWTYTILNLIYIVGYTIRKLLRSTPQPLHVLEL
jgi:hypothetical protein